MMSGRMSRLPWMVGIVNAEGICPVGTFIADEAELKKFDEDFENLAPLVLDFYHTVNESDRLEVTRKIRKEYFGDKNITINSALEIVKVGYELIVNVQICISWLFTSETHIKIQNYTYFLIGFRIIQCKIFKLN